MTPTLRKLALTAHITSSVGALGAVAAFLVLAIAGLTSSDAQLVQGAYRTMQLIAWYAVAPMIGASLVTGLIQSLGTEWGLFRHYWIVAKLAINLLALLVLLLHLQPIALLANTAAHTALASTDLHGLRIQLVANAGSAVFVLLVAAVLSVYKPKGMTPYGQRQRDGIRQAVGTAQTADAPRWVAVSRNIVLALLVLFIVLHLTGNSLGGHGVH